MLVLQKYFLLLYNGLLATSKGATKYCLVLILQTPVQDLKSQLALDLRRKMLLALARKDLYHDDEKKQREVLEKYKEFIIPVRECFTYPVFTTVALCLADSAVAARHNFCPHYLHRTYQSSATVP